MGLCTLHRRIVEQQWYDHVLFRPEVSKQGLDNILLSHIPSLAGLLTLPHTHPHAHLHRHTYTDTPTHILLVAEIMTKIQGPLPTVGMTGERRFHRVHGTNCTGISYTQEFLRLVFRVSRER